MKNLLEKVKGDTNPNPSNPNPGNNNTGSINGNNPNSSSTTPTSDTSNLGFEYLIIMGLCTLAIYHLFIKQSKYFVVINPSYH
ncbi:MAG: hypothetical protein ACK5LC_05685 [Coprobacillaceae bacterium]